MSTSDKYEQAKSESEILIEEKVGDKETPKNEMRITAQGRVGSFLRRAVNILEGKSASRDKDTEKPEKDEIGDHFDSVVLKGMGRAITNTVVVAEVIKRRVKNLYQKTECYSSLIEDTYKAKEEGLKDVTVKRNIAAITITLSKLALDENDKGYQAPLTEKEESERQNALQDARKEANLTASRRKQQRNYRGKGNRRRKSAKDDSKKNKKENENNAKNDEQQSESEDSRDNATDSVPTRTRGRGRSFYRGRYGRGRGGFRRGRGSYRGRYRSNRGGRGYGGYQERDFY